MKFRGTVHAFGDNVDTDAIIPARYLNTSRAEELACHCMEDADDGFAGRVRAGDILVAGANFGCGSSREHAPIAIKAAGVSCVIAASFARIFYRNAINIALPIFACPAAAAALSSGAVASVDAVAGEIVDETTGASFRAEPLPPFMRELIAAGGPALTTAEMGDAVAAAVQCSSSWKAPSAWKCPAGRASPEGSASLSS